MVRTLGENVDWLTPYLTDFRQRFLQLLSFSFHTLTPPLCLYIIDCVKGTPQDTDLTELQSSITLHDLQRLEAYAKSMVDYHLILDLIPRISLLYFTYKLPITLSALQTTILLCVGL
jgi:N-acetyltransferase 10